MELDYLEVPNLTLAAVRTHWNMIWHGVEEDSSRETLQN